MPAILCLCQITYSISLFFEMPTRPQAQAGRQRSASPTGRNGEQRVKSIAKMITASAAALSAFALVAMAAPVAQAGEYCMTNTSGMRGCGYATLEQCQISASGSAGTCAREPSSPIPTMPWPTTPCPTTPWPISGSLLTREASLVRQSKRSSIDQVVVIS
jgi:hypothetical protein